MDFEEYKASFWKVVKAGSEDYPHWLAREVLEEAEFGYATLEEDLLRVKGEPVLELGGGPMVLATFLAINGWNITSVEPKQPGFTMFSHVAKTSNHLLKQHKATLKRLDGYAENVTMAQNTYAYAYCVNVIEHVEHPVSFMKAIQSALKPQGCFRSLSASYVWLYDTHFGIPIVLNKSITYKVFARKIEAVETARNEPGLWGSIFFVTPRQIAKIGKSLDLRVRFSDQGFTALLRTLLFKPEFSKRHPIISPIFQALVRLGLLQIVRFFPATILPYMDFTTQKHFEE